MADGSSLATHAQYLARADELELEAVVFTDHFVEDPSAARSVPFYQESGPSIVHSLRARLAELERPNGCSVYVGCETETLSPEWVGVGPEMAEELDFVLVPTTHYHLPGVPQPPSFKPTDVAAHMLTMLESVVTKPWLDAVAHPFAEKEALIGDLRAIYEAMNLGRLGDILGVAAQNGIALEVNDAALRSESLPNYASVFGEIARLAKGIGVRFSFGSDAHEYRNLGMTSGVEAWIRTVGLVESDFVTPAQVRSGRS